MINTNNPIVANNVLSINQLHDVILTNAQNMLLDYTKSALLKHNRSRSLRFGFYSATDQFRITNDTKVADFYNEYLDNPRLKQTDSQDKINKVSSQILTEYFNGFSINGLINIACTFDGFCDENLLNTTLIANYLKLSDTSDAFQKLAFHISRKCLTEFTAYWLDNFDIIEQYCQKDCKYLDIIIQPYLSKHVTEMIIPVFIKKIADLITKQYPDYLCKTLIEVIDYQFTDNASSRINLPFKYLESYFRLWAHSHILIKKLNRNKKLSPIPINCQLITAKDEKCLLELLIGKPHNDDFDYDSYKLQEFINLGLTFDANNHQADIRKLIDNLKLLPKVDRISKYIVWLQKTFL